MSRLVARGAVSTSLLIVLAAVCGACSTDSDEAPAGARTSSSSSTSEPRKALVLGPDGVGPIKLGMTPQAVAGTNVADIFRGSPHDGWPDGCRVVVYRPEVLGQADTISGSVSTQKGLEQLSATTLMATPEGIRLGSSMADVSSAYGLPDVQPGDMVVVRASDTADYQIQLDPDVVTSISLELRSRRCII